MAGISGSLSTLMTHLSFLCSETPTLIFFGPNAHQKGIQVQEFTFVSTEYIHLRVLWFCLAHPPETVAHTRMLLSSGSSCTFGQVHTCSEGTTCFPFPPFKVEKLELYCTCSSQYSPGHTTYSGRTASCSRPQALGQPGWATNPA